MGERKKKMSSAKHNQPLMAHIRKYWQLYLFMLIPIVYFVVFRYLPMFGSAIAFRKYRAGSSLFGDRYVGLRYFEQFIRDQSFWRAFRNTLTLNLSYLTVRFPLTLIFALLLNEIRKLHWKKFVQTVSYLPHFISMVVIAGMVKEIVSANGPINQLVKFFGGDPITFMSAQEWFPTIFITSGVWQALGWGTIMYLAAISSINPSLYEAAKMDGANKFQQALYITVPCILPTITTLLILDIGGLVGSGAAFEKVFLLYNSMIYESSDIVSTFVYRMGVGSSNYSYATAVGLFEGMINLVLLTVANKLSKKVSGSGLW